MYAAGQVVGFAMWAFDPGDQSGWVGGLTVDAERQGQGIGRAAMERLLVRLRDEQLCSSAALSYQPNNLRAKSLYASLGFAETGEMEDDELVARLGL